MKMFTRLIMFIIAVSLAAVSPVMAAPQYSVQSPGSAILISAQNDEDSSYQAHIVFDWLHDDFGETKSQHVDTYATVGAHQSGYIFKLQGAWVNVRVAGQVSVTWSKL